MLTLTPSKTLSDEPICSHTCSMDHLMISQYWRKSADTTYTLTAVDNDTDGPNGLPSITSTLTIKGDGADTTILERASSAPGFRLVHVTASGSLQLHGLTVRGGGCDRPSCEVPPGANGAGLYNNGGTVRLVQTTVTRNGAQNSGTG